MLAFPRINSLQVQLLLLWVFILLVSLALGAVLVDLYRRGSAGEIDAGQRATARGCRGIQALVAANFTRDPESKTDKDLLNVLIAEALRELPGVEGGVWGRSVGNIAYAFPTHEGAIPKVDAPADELPWIISLAQRALMGAATQDVRRGRRDAVSVSACPLKPDGFAAWTMTRIRLASADAYDRLTIGLGLLLGFVLLSGGWLTYALTRWSRAVVHLEQTLAHHPIEKLPLLDMAGQPDLDRVIGALNTFTTRLSEAQAHATELGLRLAQADRLAALGRIAAGVAHEIRNPIGAMRLKAENAIGQPVERQEAALRAVIGQIDRLDRLCESLLAVSRPLAVDKERVNVKEWLEQRRGAFAETAKRQKVQLGVTCDVEQAEFDPHQLGRALDNLLVNALQHVREGGRMHVTASKQGDRLHLTVSDDGPGVPEELRPQIFEPFVTGRGGGTGLGLAIVRETVEAHGGTVRLVPSATGGVFEMELPWHAS
jgi:two-component system, NtrC family, sensor histidine kinase HydH